jgi:hypothetical protein
MTSPPSRSIRSTRAAFLAAMVFVAPAAIAAHVVGNWQDSAIGVHDGRYFAGGKAYSTLDALEAAVRASRPATLLIVSCTPAATRSWLAVVPRFDDLPMHLDVSDGSSPACKGAIPVSASGGAASAGVEPAVRQYWDRRMP